MRKEEAEAAAEALLQPEKQRQQAFQARAQSPSELLRSPGQRAWKAFALLGLLSGGVIGHFVYGNLASGLMLGAAAGSVVGAVARAAVNRRSAL